MQKRIVLVGAGSAQFGYGTIGDILQSKVLEGSQIVLHDINPDTLAVVEQNGRAFIEEHGLPFSISATTNRAEAFQGADFIISSIEVGNRFELWEQDWRIPQQYGVQQVYGENGGPGGLFHSLRIIPPILEICADVMRICPEATVFNFSNPMSRICTTVHRAFPELKFIGMCHEIGSLRNFLPRILGVPYEALEVRAGGLNHFSVVLSAKYRDSGQDAYADIRAKAPRSSRTCHPWSGCASTSRRRGSGPKSGGFRRRRERSLARTAGVPGDPGEIRPAADHERQPLRRVHPVGLRCDRPQGDPGFLPLLQGIPGEHPAQIELRLGERIIPIIEGILTDSGYVEEAVNIPNRGLIANLPDWIVVEVPATVDKDGVHGIPLGELPRGFAGLLMNQVAVHDLTAEAVIHKSKALALQALLVDPVVNQYRGWRRCWIR